MDRARKRLSLWERTEHWHLWMWVCLASFPVSVLVLLIPSLHWGTNSDDAWYFYEDGHLSWASVLRSVFLPSAHRVFIFGEDRPVQTLFFKLMYELGVSPTGFHVVSWIVTFAACIGFGWGIVALARLAWPLRRDAMWLIAALVWWAPGGVFGAAVTLLSAWVLGLVGAFWALWYGEGPRPRWKLALALVLGFIGCQAVEDAWPLLAWSTLWVGACVWLRKGSGASRRDWLQALVPAMLVLFHVLVYRSLDPKDANRSEIIVSLEPSILWWTFEDYLMVALYAVAEPFRSWQEQDPTTTGLGPAPYPIAFLLCTAGWAGVIYANLRAGGPKALRRASWLMPVGALIAIAPYLAIANRHFFYYALKLNALISAFFVLRAFMSAQERPRQCGLPLLAAALYLSGVAVSGSDAMLGWNFTKHYAPVMRNLLPRAMSIPGAASCTSEQPCCLRMNGPRTWANHEWIVDWLLGAPKNPPFVSMDMPCAKTLQMP